MEGLLAMLLSEHMGVQLNGSGNGSGSRPEAALREQMLQRLTNEQAQGTTASASTTTQVLAPSTPVPEKN